MGQRIQFDISLVPFWCEVMVPFDLFVPTNQKRILDIRCSIMYHYLPIALLDIFPFPAIITDQPGPFIELGARAVIPYADIGYRRAAQTFAAMIGKFSVVQRCLGYCLVSIVKLQTTSSPERIPLTSDTICWIFVAAAGFDQQYGWLRGCIR